MGTAKPDNHLGDDTIRANTPAGEADEYKALQLLQAGRIEEAMPHLLAGMEAGRPICQIFTGLHSPNTDLASFLENLNNIFAGLLEILETTPDEVITDILTKTRSKIANAAEAITIKLFISNHQLTSPTDKDLLKRYIRRFLETDDPATKLGILEAI